MPLGVRVPPAIPKLKIRFKPEADVRHCFKNKTFEITSIDRVNILGGDWAIWIKDQDLVSTAWHDLYADDYEIFWE